MPLVRPVLTTAVLVATIVISSTAMADVLGPYTADANTLHLWHLDEANPGPAQPAAGVSGSFNLTPINGATLGNSADTGFGTSANTAAASNSGLQGNSISVSDITAANGAFTMEALINTSNTSNKQQIISMDNTGSNSSRPFQFALLNGELRFVNIAGSLQQLVATIPTTGDDAFESGAWFHVAATYTGDANTADNFKLYWTRVDDSANEANEIFSGNMLNDVGGSASVFGVGNEFRAPPGEGFDGSLDEVRISDIVRGPGDFIFGTLSSAVPEPNAALLVGLGTALLLGTRRRRRT